MVCSNENYEHLIDLNDPDDTTIDIQPVENIPGGEDIETSVLEEVIRRRSRPNYLKWAP